MIVLKQMYHELTLGYLNQQVHYFHISMRALFIRISGEIGLFCDTILA